MATWTVSSIKDQAWYTQRIADLGAAGIVSRLEIGADTTIRTLMIASETVALRISSWDLTDGSTMPATCYFVMPASNAIRIPVVSDQAGRLVSVVCVAGDANNAPVSWAVEYGDFTSEQLANM